MKSRLFILVTAIVAVFSLSSCQKTSWVPDFELEVDYKVLTLPANINTEGGNYYTNYIQVWSVHTWEAELIIEGEAIWCGFELESDRPTGTHAKGYGSVDKYVNYLPLYFLVNGAQEPRFAEVKFYLPGTDVERTMKIQQNGR